VLLCDNPFSDLPFWWERTQLMVLKIENKKMEIEKMEIDFWACSIAKVSREMNGYIVVAN
jgi:hypothetical protein